jgi:hypothetical protein
MVFNINFREYFFYYFLLGSLLIVGVLSYFHFVIKSDYVVYYEGECDPAIESCFVGCEDDGCTEEYFYSKVQKYAPDVIRECGEYITECAKANICLSTDQECSITYCDPETDGSDCSLPTVEENNISSVDADVLLENSNIEQ